MNFSSLIESLLLNEGAQEDWGTRAAWIHAQTGEVIPVGRAHLRSIVLDPQRFGVSDSSHLSYDEAMHAAQQNGWVRFNREGSELTFSGVKGSDARSTILEICAAALRERASNADLVVYIAWSTNNSTVGGGTEMTTVGAIVNGTNESVNFLSEGAEEEHKLIRHGGGETSWGECSCGNWAWMGSYEGPKGRLSKMRSKHAQHVQYARENPGEKAV